MEFRKFFPRIKRANSEGRPKKKHIVLLTGLEKMEQGLESEKG
jgi:hypothetical protein